MQFFKGVKIHHFLVKSFLGNFCRHLAIFSGHTQYWLVLAMDSDMARRVVDRNVIVSHNCHYNQNVWSQINVQEVYFPLALLCDVG